MGSVQKVCVDCNTDVANKKRVKDAQGNYYCQSCYDARAAQKRPAAPAAVNAARTPEPAAAAAAVADPYDFPPEPQDIGDIGFAEEANPPAVEASSPDMFGCADCKTLVPSTQIRNDDGEFVCNKCFAKRRSTVRPRSSTSMAASEPSKPVNIWKILGYSAGAVVVILGIMIAVSILLPDVSRKVFGWSAVIGLIVHIIGLRWATYTAASDNLGLRVACRFIPFLGYIVVIRRAVIDWGEMQTQVLTSLAGLLLAIVAGSFWFGITVSQAAARAQHDIQLERAMEQQQQQQQQQNAGDANAPAAGDNGQAAPAAAPADNNQPAANAPAPN